jgi:hypothetical protein
MNGLSTNGGGRLKMISSADTLITPSAKAIWFSGASTEGLLLNGTIIAGGDVNQADSVKAFVAGPNHTVVFSGSGARKISLAHAAPGQSRFGRIVHDMTDTLYLKSDVRAYSFTTGAAATHPVRVAAGAAPSFPSLIVQGADVDGAVFNGTHFQLLDSLAVPKLANVAFLNSDPAGVPLIIKRTGSAGPPSGALPALSGAWSFGTTPSTGHYMDAEDTDGSSPDVLHVAFSGTISPNSHGGKIGLTGGATTSWTNIVTANWVGTSSAWTTASNWSTNAVPDSLTNVVIGTAPYAPSLSSSARANDLTIQAGGSLSLGASAKLTLSGNAVLDVAANTVSCTGGAALEMIGSNKTVQGRTCSLVIRGTISAAGNVFVKEYPAASSSGYMYVQAGNFDVAGRYLEADYISTTGVDDGQVGTFTMDAAADSVRAKTVQFHGGSSVGKLTAGTMIVTSQLMQGSNSSISGKSAQSFVATTGHKVLLGTPGATAPSNVYLDQYDCGVSGSSFGSVHVLDSASVSTNSWTQCLAMKSLTMGRTTGQATFSGLASRVYIGGGALNNVQFANIDTVVIGNDAPITQFDNVTLSPESYGTTRLRFERSTGTLTANNLTIRFDESNPSDGARLPQHFLAVDGLGGSFTLQVPNIWPRSHGGRIAMGNGGVIDTTSWRTRRALTWTGLRGAQMSIDSSWSPIGKPHPWDDISVPISGTNPEISGYLYARNISVAPGAVMNQAFGANNVLYAAGDSLAFGDTLTAPTCAGGTAVTLVSSAGLRGRPCTLQISTGDTVTLTGALRTPTFYNYGHLVLNGKQLTASQFVHSGTLNMSNPTDVIDALSSASFASSDSTQETISTGLIKIHGTMSMNGRFKATGSNRVVVVSDTNVTAAFDFSSSQGNSLNRLEIQRAVKIGNSYGQDYNLRVADTLRLGSTGSVSASNVSYPVALDLRGPLVGAPGSSIAVRKVRLTNVFADTGTFTADTTVWAGTGQAIKRTVNFASPSYGHLIVKGSATIASDTSYSFSSIRVDSVGQLTVGSATTNSSVSASGALATADSGRLIMPFANTNVSAAAATFGGASTGGFLTNGVFSVGGNFTQSGATSAFAPSGTHLTRLTSAGTVTFANPATSFFNDLSVASDFQLVSDVTVKGTLSRSTAPQTWTISSTTQQLLVTSGIIGDGLYPLGFNGARLRFIEGTSNYLVQNLNFSGFTAFTGTIFEVMRDTPATLALTGINFNSVTLSGAGELIKNNGSIPLNPTGNKCTVTISPGQACNTP